MRELVIITSCQKKKVGEFKGKKKLESKIQAKMKNKSCRFLV